jgi:MFS family permease
VAFRTAASSIYASTYSQLIKEFHTSQEVATLGLSLFVVGLAISPMALGPLSEVICLCIESWYHFTDIHLVLWPEIYLYYINILFSAVQHSLCCWSKHADDSCGTISRWTSRKRLLIPAKVGPPMMLFTMSPFIGPPLGPLLGGFINEFTSW